MERLEKTQETAKNQKTEELCERQLEQINGGSVELDENGEVIKSCSANNHGVGGGNCPYTAVYCMEHDCRGCTRTKPWLQ